MPPRARLRIHYPDIAMRQFILFRLLLATLLCAVSLPALAQATLATSPALACLTTVDGAPVLPEYPAIELARKEGGTLRVELEFTRPDAAPKVSIVSRPLVGNFDGAVNAQVKRLRVPCMQAGGVPVMLTQEYVFDPDQQSRVIASKPRDSADPARATQLKCMAHVDGEKRPDFPLDARKKGEEGTIILNLHFTDPAQAPTVAVVQSVKSRALRRAVNDHVAGFRIPCLKGPAVDTLIVFKYLYDNGDRIVLRDSSLLEALGAAKDLKTPVAFDFRKMQCPFDVRVTYHQPFAKNRIEQLDSAVPEREAFLDWLRELTLNMGNTTSANVFGDKFVITVPCAQLDL